MTANPRHPEPGTNSLEGTWFKVPTSHSMDVIGIASRHDPEVGIILGYFFFVPKGTLCSNDVALLAHLRPSDSILTCIFSELDLAKGRWTPTLRDHLGWDPKQWPIPDYVDGPPTGGKVIRGISNKDKLSMKTLQWVRADAKDCIGLPRFAVVGAGSLLKKLEKIPVPSDLPTVG